MQTLMEIPSLLYHNYAEQLHSLCSPVKPFPVANARLAIVNSELAASLDLPEQFLEADWLLPALFSEHGTLQQHSIAQKYGGHQFGQWNPYLGDGRGLLLAEIKRSDQQLMDIHLKGAGPTPYSRHADGRAILASSIREYIGAEALHHLGIPSSRSLALIASDEPVQREQRHAAAMLLRVCQSHIRFGHIEYYHHHNQPQHLSQLFDFMLRHHFQNCQSHAEMLGEIVKSTADLIAKWQAYGFNHGVMNTDNMSVHGITFDFGPYAFLDDYISDFRCNTSDHQGRYAFDQQPSIGLWNLNALAHGFSGVLSVEQIRSQLNAYEPRFLQSYYELMLRRLGFSDTDFQQQHATALTHLLSDYLALLASQKADYHIPFRQLSENLPSMMDDENNWSLDSIIPDSAAKAWFHNYYTWMGQYILDTKVSIKDISKQMLQVNPVFILRNNLLQSAIQAAENDDFTGCESLLQAAKHPFTALSECSHLYARPNAEARGIVLSCSS